MSPVSKNKIVLVGPMGVGKSSVAQHLSEAARISCYDTDAMVEKEVGCTVAEFFADEGEAAFRKQEAAVLARVLEVSEPCVVATGGGIVLSAENRRALLDKAKVVWLDADVQTLLLRVGDTTTRPLFKDRDPSEVLQEILVRRRDLYAEVADFYLEVSSFRTPRAVAEHLMSELGVSE